MGIIATVPNGRGGLYRARIAISDGRIAEVSGYQGGGPADKEDLDFTPHVALPGFIDLQLNGAFGHDITSDPSSMWAIGTRLAEHGVSAFLPTVVTSAPAQRQAAYRAIRSRPSGYCGAEPVGLHVEGPALSPSFPGTHPPAWLVRDADELADEILAERDIIRLVTLAPEAENAPGAISRLVQAGVAVSLGHTGATAEQARTALKAGAAAFTHLFNAMGPLHHREVGAAGAALLHPTAAVSLIADGHHLSDETLLLAWRLTGPGRVFLVTDAIAGMAAPAGTYRIGDVSVECGETARNASGGLAGSLLTMPGAARRLRTVTEASWDDLAAVTATNQARLLDDASRGALLPGRRADLAVVDARLHPAATIIEGVVVWRRRDRVAAATAAPASPVQKVREPDPGATVEAIRTSIREARPRRSDSTHTLPAAIGVDIGGTTFKAAIFDGAALGPVRRDETGSHRPAAEVLVEIRDIIIDLAAGADDLDLRGVGIACTGILDAAAGTVVRAPSLGWTGVDVIAAVSPSCGLPVALEHDVYLAALAEWETGAAVGAESMLYVSVGTGVASRLFTRSGSERGHANLAGEMGYMPVGDGERRLESVASARAMSDAYRARSGRQLTARQIPAAAAGGDPVAADVWSEAMDALAQGISAAVCLQDPEIVVVGGGVCNAGRALLDTLGPRLATRLEPLRDPPRTVLAAHGADSGIIGAALLGGLST